jgi:NitT/TauT family transport system ATP-binding protein
VGAQLTASPTFAAAAGHLSIEDVSLTYRHAPDGASFVALDSVSLVVERGAFVAIVGPSGCGKTSLLLAVNGLLQPSRGRILLDGRPVSAPGRERALVFQEAALLPWRTVAGNVELGLELKGLRQRARRAVAREAIRLVDLEGLEDRLPHQLSGGMRQRVGIARALAVDPEVLLMDEPFGALDAQLRQALGTELLRIWDRTGKTIVFVTHDIDEAVHLADQVAVMSAGPGRILDTFTIELPRPRPFEVRSTPLFGEYRQRIWRHLEGEVRRTLDAPRRAPQDAET